ncbi:GNAT family N-acetyltransferase [Celerinatantimonas yamalensis]|uniref:GNAT family N-acetyltransferase n=1 Tax=Celerinatantimonas yamalensis TaxID=559956 RepID=A0ABW9G3U1_9GAMM
MENFYAANNLDAEFIVPLIAESSGGVWPAVWKALSEKNESVEESAIRYLTDPLNDLGVKNAVLVKDNGLRVGVMITYQESRLSSDDVKKSSLPADLIEALTPYRELTDPESLFIAEICFLVQARGQGLGTKFLEYAKHLARKRGLPRLSLRVFSINLGARRFYEKNGFSLVGQKAVIEHPSINVGGMVQLMSCQV